MNADDPASETFAKKTAAQVITYGWKRKADVFAKNIRMDERGTTLEVETFKGETELRLQLVGKFSVYNALAALSAALLEDIPLPQIKRSLESVRGVPGRFERVEAGQNFTVIVDYAHTPDSLENVLSTIREFAKGRIICVVGCGGDRDRTKRPLMAEIAVRYADSAYFTSDNPRSEDPEAIIRDMLKGVDASLEEGKHYHRIADRREAIERALREAAEKDVVLIAGKGHETYQVIGRDVLPFDDREVARQFLRKR